MNKLMALLGLAIIVSILFKGILNMENIVYILVGTTLLIKYTIRGLDAQASLIKIEGNYFENIKEFKK